MMKDLRKVGVVETILLLVLCAQELGQICIVRRKGVISEIHLRLRAKV